MRLIPDARLAWRFTSVQAAALLAFLSAVQAEVLPLVQPLFPPHVWPWVSGLLALAIVVLRLLPQPSLDAVRQREFERELAEFREEADQVLALGREAKARKAQAAAHQAPAFGRDDSARVDCGGRDSGGDGGDSGGGGD